MDYSRGICFGKSLINMDKEKSLINLFARISRTDQKVQGWDVGINNSGHRIGSSYVVS